MSVTFFKRYRMHFDLDCLELPAPAMPSGFRIHAWRSELLESHAEAKFESFRSEIDAAVFPCLGNRSGCTRLMHEITTRNGFIPESTWLITINCPDNGVEESCATIQAICEAPGIGAIQNVGVAPRYRGLGLGTVLLTKALIGFKRLGLSVGSLEVTAENTGAMRLYQRYGFQIVRTVYKSIEIPVGA